MFHKASLKLASLYLAVIMLISLFFSINIYQLSVDELNHGFRNQDLSQEGGPIDLLPQNVRRQWLQDQEYAYSEAKGRTFDRLIITNLFIFVVGGAVSYYLARRTLQPIEEAHAAQSRFTADASHELRTPIAAMQTEIEVTLMDPNLTLDKTKHVLNSNLEELGKLTALTEGLLKLAQLESTEIEQTNVSISDLIDSSIDRVAPAAKAKKIKIHRDEKAKIKVLGDQASLTEAIVTLLENAVKYSPEKSEVRITSAADGNNAVIQVIDQGMGIKPKDLKHIFDRFYRADSARSKTTADGYGVGLAIAKNIVELHGGSISVSSKPNKGSTFTIQIPIE